MVKVSVAGASGYSGGELVRWLLKHPEVELVHLAAGSHSGQPMNEVFPSLEGLVDQTLVESDWKKLGEASDVVFLGLPHGMALEAAPILLEAGAKVIDLGADFRLKDTALYHRWYGLEHTQPELLKGAVYGLPEINRDAIRTADLIANPGCYPTTTCLPLLPLLATLTECDPTIIVDGKSGVSGAGRGVHQSFLYSEVNENVRPYKVGDHRHMPEMEQTLSGHFNKTTPKVFFTPVLVPMTRGILSTSYLRCDSPPSRAELLEAMRKFYASEPFVRVRESFPETKGTYGSNYCDVSVQVDQEAGVICAMGALDNLVKGAAGQAIQNFNLMFGFAETTGLDVAPSYP